MDIAAKGPSGSIALRFEDRAGHLYVHISGDTIDEPSALDAWRRIAEECRARRCTRLLAENALLRQLTVTEAFYVSQAIPTLGFQGVRMAFLDRRGLDYERTLFAETVAVNRGLVGRVFNNLPAAEEWLASADAG